MIPEIRHKFNESFSQEKYEAMIAEIRQEFPNQLDFRVGRINFDAFLMSDHRHVGYAYPWVRPPSEFYAWIPIFSMDGIDAAYNFQSKDARWRIKAQAGAWKRAHPDRQRLDLRLHPLGIGHLGPIADPRPRDDRDLP